MNRLSTLIIVFITALSLQSCNSDTKSDEEIISNILPQIVDSLEIQHIQFPPPPPPNDSIKIYPDLIKWRKKLDSIESQDKMIILVDDTLEIIEKDNFKIKKILESNNFSSLSASFEQNKIPRKIDLKKLNNFNDYEFLYMSNHIKTGLQIFDIENKKFGGLLRFSQVYLNESKSKGILKCSYIISRDFGQGYILTIEKIENQWRITEFHFNWIS
ncbi:hypothetical protein [Mesonia aestuariivivens]|uniref:Lipoprotein n=1 Tax=Mesonia aestuariivivens TaxID=2796128 RepID=A0ABS6W5E1_9FLAO|nr:hypothetical protein [Mesonia aestuariivivens]MBW2963065.1 hypothetical protein [Mesonia aestuariivivens]